MKTLIIVSSSYLGNTMKVASAIGKELNATIKTVDEMSSVEISNYNLIGIGSAINFASHSKNILRLVEVLSLENKKVFIFSTRCRPILGKYHMKLRILVERKKGILLGEFSCCGFDRTGPWVGMNGYNKNRPNSKDLFNATVFANDIRRKAHPLYKWKNTYPIINHYKGLDVRPNNVIGSIVLLDKDTCIKCHKCVDSCPMNVFLVENDTENDVIPIGEKNCIQCGLCQKRCPKDAIYINETFSNGVRILFREVFTNYLHKAYWFR